MRSPVKCLIFVFLFSLFKFALAWEPEMVLEMGVEGKRTGGDILDGKLILSSQDKLWVATPQGEEAFHMDLKPNQGVVASADGGFFGITTLSPKASPGFLAADKFELYSSDGKKLWEIEKPEASDFYVSPGGRLIAGLSSREGNSKSRLIFYDKTGNLTGSAKIEIPQEFSFSPIGDYLLVNTVKDGLLAFGDSGVQVAEYGLCQKFAVSRDGMYVATVSDGNLRFFVKGKPIGNTVEIDRLVRGMSFSPEDAYICVFDKMNLYLFEVPKGKLIWQYTLNQPELSFISADVSSDAERVIAGLDFDKGSEVSSEERHTKGLVYVFDRDGKIAWEGELSYRLWGSLFPRVRFSSDGSRFSVLTREKIYLFDVIQPEK
jgi:hypothetical protein